MFWTIKRGVCSISLHDGKENIIENLTNILGYSLKFDSKFELKLEWQLIYYDMDDFSWTNDFQ